MMQKHSTDAEIQEFVFNPKHSDSSAILHINTCEICRQTAQQYQTLFTEVEKQPTVSFDFNVSDLVLPQLKSKSKIIFDFVPVLISGTLVLASLGFVAYLKGFDFWLYFQGVNFTQWFQEISKSTFLLITTALIVLFFVVLDIHKNFQKKWELLSTY